MNKLLIKISYNYAVFIASMKSAIEIYLLVFCQFD